MEPVITAEGFKILQNPDESRSLLSAYYQTLGFNVVNITDSSSALTNKSHLSVQHNGDAKK